MLALLTESLYISNPDEAAILKRMHLLKISPKGMLMVRLNEKEKSGRKSISHSHKG